MNAAMETDPVKRAELYRASLGHWRGARNPDGPFSDPRENQGNHYAGEGLGVALLQQGAQEAGLRALAQAAARSPLGIERTQATLREVAGTLPPEEVAANVVLRTLLDLDVAALRASGLADPADAAWSPPPAGPTPRPPSPPT